MSAGDCPGTQTALSNQGEGRAGAVPRSVGASFEIQLTPVSCDVVEVQGPSGTTKDVVCTPAKLVLVKTPAYCGEGGEGSAGAHAIAAMRRGKAQPYLPPSQSSPSSRP